MTTFSPLNRVAFQLADLPAYGSMRRVNFAMPTNMPLFGTRLQCGHAMCFWVAYRPEANICSAAKLFLYSITKPLGVSAL